jgi:AcrR family transcriptional regulator
MTMDELARGLGVSKKTLYRFVDNRNEMVQKGMDLFLSSTLDEIEAIKDQASDPIEELVLIDRMMSNRLCNIQSSVIFDLERYHPQVYREMLNKRKSLMVRQTADNIRRGIDQGLYRAGIHPEHVAEFHYSTMLWITSPDLMQQAGYNIAEVLRESLLYHIHGLATDRGLALLQQYLPHD